MLDMRGEDMDGDVMKESNDMLFGSKMIQLQYATHSSGTGLDCGR